MKRIALGQKIAIRKATLIELSDQIRDANAKADAAEKEHRHGPKRKRSFHQWFVDLHGSRGDAFRIQVEVLSRKERALRKEIAVMEEEYAILNGQEQALSARRDQLAVKVEIAQFEKQIADLIPAPPREQLKQSPEQRRAEILAKLASLDSDLERVLPSISDPDVAGGLRAINDDKKHKLLQELRSL